MQAERVGEVLGRGVRGCPWAKRVVMGAFLEVGMEEKGKEMYRVMQEKELRIHVDLDEWLEERGAQDLTVAVGSERRR